MSREGFVELFFVSLRFFAFCFLLTEDKTQKTSKPKNSAGGVVARTPDGRISCSNTLDARLAIAYAQKLPEIRASLFGEA